MLGLLMRAIAFGVMNPKDAKNKEKRQERGDRAVAKISVGEVTCQRSRDRLSSILRW
ncbi:hypothetical protein [Coleofasciculus sp. FACHB-1120]|uniref:hypothetical protein n=1 Tax=Coleofasciculus sp. FACHB-1120 TaxID=2692783 RepID=UPI0016840DE6|nr:hypothetical protein [Coleofasciculus sp. FACHB-1120]MBD2743286.1 hypothetical protein [Coleofasciculus sp. FACHB-1120]